MYSWVFVLLHGAYVKMVDLVGIFGHRFCVISKELSLLYVDGILGHRICVTFQRDVISLRGLFSSLYLERFA